MSDEYVKNEEIIETRWDCPSCKATNRGRDMKCPTCGAPKDEDAEYEVDASAAAIADAAQIADADAGAHWVCAFCEKENRGRKQTCQFCGADQTKRDRRRMKAAGPAAPAKKSNVMLGCGIALLVGVVIVGFLAWLGMPRRIDAKVTHLEWTQAVNLHARSKVPKENWSDAVQQGAFEKSCERRQRTTREVVDRYRTVSKTRRVKYQSGSREECRTETENLSNGYAKRREVCRQVPEYDYRNENYTEQEPVYRTEPVYDEWCRYDVWEWPISKTVKRTGTAATELAWPDPSELGAGSPESCDTARAGPTAQECWSREAKYAVSFENPEKPEERPVYRPATGEEFAKFAVGQEHALEIDDGKVTIAKEE